VQLLDLDGVSGIVAVRASPEQTSTVNMTPTIPKPGRVHGRASSETLNAKTALILPIGHGGSCLDHCALGKNAIIPAQRVQHLPAEL
jgi:hypothetical protein